jgi:uncharacterized surface protein with fasciclin (FAS1) repeats
MAPSIAEFVNSDPELTILFEAIKVVSGLPADLSVVFPDRPTSPPTKQPTRPHPPTSPPTRYPEEPIEDKPPTEVTPPQQYLGYTGYKGIYGSYAQPYKPGNVYEYLELVEQLVQQQGSVGVNNAGYGTFTPGVYNSGSGAFTSTFSSACPECPRNLRFVQNNPFRRGNLLQILDEPGDFTFLAPTNAAFRTIPVEVLELLFLQEEFIPHLADLLLYHALEGKRLVQDFFAVEIISAFNQEGVLVRQNPLRINGNSVVRPNRNASNGVTHIINGVLIPDWVANSIIGFVSSMDDMSLLFEFLERAGLVQELDTLGDELTLVGPTNDAFTALGEDALGFLRDPDNQSSLVEILEYHIILKVFTSPELVDGDSLDTRRQGSSVEVSVGGITIMFNQANVVPRNGINGASSDSILAKNGVLYKIDSVLNPNSLGGF